MSSRVPVVLLPGVVLPAELAYADLIRELGPTVDARPKELEIYREDQVPEDFGLLTEVEGIRRFADTSGFDLFHLVGYSAGGAASAAFCALYPERLLSLALNEPAWIGSEGLSREEEDRWREFDRVAQLPPDEMMPAFVRAQLRDDVEPPPPPDGPPPSWMKSRPAGVKAIIAAFKTHELDYGKLRNFNKPVLFTLGGRSHPGFYAQMAKRLEGIFRDFRVELYEDRHHFDPPHRSEPEKFARTLKTFWQEAGSKPPTSSRRG